jgi:Flp pilus assembly pilin Flp
VITRSRGAWFSRPLRDEQGANLVEYILLVALIALVVLAAVIFLGGEVRNRYDHSGSELSSAFE